MLDVLYVLITVLAFAGLALLVGVLDRRLVAPDSADPAFDPTPDAHPVPTESVTPR